MQGNNKSDDVPGDVGGSTIKIKVSHGSNQYELSVPSDSSFGHLKSLISREVGLEPQLQKLLFRGKEKEDQEYLNMAGVKDNAKLLLVEDPSSMVKKLEDTKATTNLPIGSAESGSVTDTRPEEVTGTTEISRGGAAVAEVKAEVDKLSEQVAALQAVVCGGSKIDETDIVCVTEMLMRQLLKLDSIDAEGEGKAQRKMEVRRVQGFVETMDSVKERNANPFSNSSQSVSVTTQWETFESGVGSLNPPPARPSSTVVTQDWEQFD